jgi:hypothetical protein
MFGQDRGATAVYRTLARGRGSNWVRTYQASQRMHTRARGDDRKSAGVPLPRAASNPGGGGRNLAGSSEA